MKIRTLTTTFSLLIFLLFYPMTQPVLSQSNSGETMIRNIIGGKTITPISQVTGSKIPTKPRGPMGIVAFPGRGPGASKKEAGQPVNTLYKASRENPIQARPAVGPGKGSSESPAKITSMGDLLNRPLVGAPPIRETKPVKTPRVKAKAVFCVDNSCDRVVLAQNVTEPLPIASITKLLTAMTVIDTMNLKRVVRIPDNIRLVPRHRVGVRPGDLITVEDLLHGMLIESGNDCAEALARAYPKGREAFIKKMNQRAKLMGAIKTKIYTPSGLDMTKSLGRKNGRELRSKHPNVATAQDVALIAKRAFQYPHIRRISSMKSYKFKTRNKKPRTYVLKTNDKLLHRRLPVAGAKTGYTNLAGRCIVAQFKDDERDYTVVVLNTKRHFREAEKLFKWICKTF